MSLFLKDPTEYKRDLDIFGNYKKNLAAYVSVMKNIPYEEALTKVTSLSLNDGPLTPKVPRVKALVRKHAHADKEKAVLNFDDMLRDITRTKRILSPSLIVYENPEVDLCYQAEFIDNGLGLRSISKHKAHKAAASYDEYEALVARVGGENISDDIKKKSASDKFAASFYSKEQVNIKTLNNSFSGANCSPHNPNFAKSVHTSLTSTTRTATSNSNSSTEKFMGGNRHYYSYDIAIENMSAAIRLSNSTLIERVMSDNNLSYPTADYVFDRIRRHCDMYWSSDSKLEKIKEYVFKMSDVQLVAVIGIGDLWSWIDTNPKYVRTMFSKLTIDDNNVEDITIEEAIKWGSEADSYMESLATFLTSNEMDGKGLNPKESPDVYRRYGARVKLLTERITKDYDEFFKAFFITDLMPQSVHAFPTSIRKVVIASDTDSTLFTTQGIIEWYCDGLKFDHTANMVRELVTYLNSQIICHILANVSANMGVNSNKLFNIKMKPEYSMPVIGVTNRAKHYFFTKSACEGKVFSSDVMETKGVGLKSSKVPRWIIEIFNDYVSEITDIFKAGKKITSVEAASVPAYLEHKIVMDLESGRSDALYNAKIKDKGGYKNPMQSNYLYYDLWEEVFAPKYGTMGDLTVEVKKVPINIPNKTALSNWLAELDGVDSALAERMRVWLAKSGKTNFTMILVPQIFLLSNPIPSEIWIAVNLAKLLKDLTESFYYVLEILGIYFKNKNLTRFAYNEIPMEIAKENLILDLSHLD